MHRLLPFFPALFLTVLSPPLSADISFSNRARGDGEPTRSTSTACGPGAREQRRSLVMLR